MKTNTTNTPARSTEALLERAHGALRRAEYATLKGRDADVTAAQERYNRVYAAYINRTDVSDADRAALEGEATNVTTVEGNGLEARLQRALNELRDAQSANAHEIEIRVLQHHYDTLNREFVQSMWA